MDAKKITQYAQESYFKHLRLYEYCFNNKTASELKKITFTQEVTATIAPLTQALQISKGKPPAIASSDIDTTT